MAELTGAGHSQRQALTLAGISRSTWHYRCHGRPRSAVVVPHAQRRSAAWLTEQETAEISARLAARDAGVSVHEAFYQAFDAGTPIASLSSWHRIERKPRGGPPVRRERRQPPAMPCVSATGPMQVWVWDITELPGPFRGITYHLYVVMDLLSRLIVGYRVEDELVNFSM